MSPWRTVRLVTAREIRTRGGTRGYLFGTGLTLLLIVAAIVVPTLFGGPPTERTLGVVGTAPDDLGTQLDALLDDGVTTRVTELADAETAREAVLDDDADAALVEGRQLLRHGPDGPMGDDLRTALDLVLQRAATAEALAELGITGDDADAAFAPVPQLETVDVTEGGPGDPDGGGFMVAVGLTVLLFLGIQLNGASVLTGALEEKSNRVVEVLVSVARPWQLLTGKLLGMSLLAIAQIGVIVAGALGANAAVDAVELPATTPALVGVSLVMLVAGFLFYASLYAVAGSLASSLEDAQSSAAPLGFLLTGAYFAVFIAVLPAPNSVASQILSFVPPTAPFVLPARLGLGGVPTWQAVASIAVTTLAAFATVRLAGRLYASSLLAGGKLSWREAWRGEPVR